MSSAEKMVMVPRELAEAFRSYSSWAANPELKKAHLKLNDILDQPAQQHQGEPVALPARRDENQGDDFRRGTAHGFNACLVTIAKLGPLYTHADPGEVERLRVALEGYQWGAEVEAKAADEARAEVKALRAQLAEAHALLNTAEGLLRNGRHLGQAGWQSCVEDFLTRPRKALSASAEPSAPVEIDELLFDPIEWLEVEISAVDTWYRGSPSYEHDAGWMKDQALRLVSEARAALERKQNPPKKPKKPKKPIEPAIRRVVNEKVINSDEIWGKP